MFNYSFRVSDLEYFLLILTRVTLFIYAAPFFSTQNVPQRVKIGISIFLSLLVFRFVVPHEALEYRTVMGYSILVIREAICGVLIGFSANVMLYATQLAGTLIDMDIGLSMVQMFDPVMRVQTGFTGSIYQYGMLLILMVSGLEHFVIRALVDAFALIPVGHIEFHADGMMDVMLRIINSIMLIGFRIFLPIFAAMLLLNAVLGIMAKVAPQMNMFTVGIQIKILVGLGVLMLTIGMLPSIADMVFDMMRILVTDIVGTMTG